MDDIFYQYYEDLLSLQFDASQQIIDNHEHAKGIVREDFLKKVILDLKDSFKINKGFISYENKKSGECDLIFYQRDSISHGLGECICVKPSNCNLVLEVKSNATTLDLEKTNKNFERIKSLDHESDPQCGLFCYNFSLAKTTVLKRFGYSFDKSIDVWEQDENLMLLYPNIDFIINIASSTPSEERLEEQCFLRKDDFSGTFALMHSYPIIKNFFGVIDNL